MAGKKHSPIHMPTDPAVLGYLAGLFDGEGCLCIGERFNKGKSTHVYHSIYLYITNTDMRVMVWLLETVGGRQYPLRREKEHHAFSCHWVLNSANMYVFLQSVRPYLIIKAEQADCAMELYETIQADLHKNHVLHHPLTEEQVTQRRALKARMNVLNRRGA